MRLANVLTKVAATPVPIRARPYLVYVRRRLNHKAGGKVSESTYVIRWVVGACWRGFLADSLGPDAVLVQAHQPPQGLSVMDV